MDPDMNKYDLEHALTKHPVMGVEGQKAIYDRAWHLYFSPEHIETLLKRAVVSHGGTGRLVSVILQFWGSYKLHGLHPLQSGLGRRILRTNRRYGMRRENPLVFHPKRLWTSTSNALRLAWMAFKLIRMGRRLKRDPKRHEYTDLALTPVDSAADEDLEMFDQTAAAREAVERAQRQAQQRAKKPVR